MSKPRLFIGSSVEGLEIAYAIQENLKFITESTVWDQGVFNLSESSLESLITILDCADFGVFVFSPDDHIKIRGKKDLAVRDNVLFELGLFLGKLGRKRSFIVVPDNKEFHLPTDLIGLTPAKFEAARIDKNYQAATGSACHKIRDAILKQGKFNITNEAPEVSNTSEIAQSNNKEDWSDYMFLKQDYDKAIELLKKKIRYLKSVDEKVLLKGWVCYAEFKKNPLNGTKEYETLISDYPDNNASYLAYVNNLFWNNSFRKAIEVAEIGIQKCSRKITLTNLKAKSLWALDNKPQAIDLLKEILDQTKDIDLFITLIDFYIDSNDNDSAFKLLHEAYFTFPDNDEVKYKFAKVAYDVNQKEICVLLYKDLISITPSNSNYWCLLGNSYVDLKLENLALSAYEKAAELSGHQQGWIYDNIGNLYNNRNLYDKAEQNLKLALSLNEKSDYTHSRLSSVYTSKDEENKKVLEIIAKGRTKLNSTF